MELAQASLLANSVLIALHPFCSGLMIAGSIRRQKAEVGDVDIVAMPKGVVAVGPLGGPVSFPENSVWSLLIPKELKKLGLKVEASGQELHRCFFPDGFQVDVYRARQETWGIILLVRTGSKEHNVKLCTLARSKGLMLSASQGVLDKSGIIACRTEEGIFSALGLKFVEPQNREVH
jgi:DNA polymerase/3'-5' exonuclease PolX